MRFFVLDRFEGGFAVCEGERGERALSSREFLPPGAGEGSILREDDGGTLLLDMDETRRRRRRILEKQRRLFGE